MLDAFNGQLPHARLLVTVADQVVERLFGCFRLVAITVVLPASLQAAPLPTASAGPQFYICAVVTGQAGFEEMECGTSIGAGILPEQLGELRQESSSKFQARLAVEHVPRLNLAETGSNTAAQKNQPDVTQAVECVKDHRSGLDIFLLLLGSLVGCWALYAGLVDELFRWLDDLLESLAEWLKK